MDFVILKVNGQDVSNLSYEDAVSCFESAEEPIIVEVLKRQPNQHPTHAQDKISHDKIKVGAKEDERLIKSEATTNALVSTGVQTDWAGLLDEDDFIPITLSKEELINSSLDDDFLAYEIDFEESPTICDNNPVYQNGVIERLIQQQQHNDRHTECPEMTSTLKPRPPVPFHRGYNETQQLSPVSPNSNRDGKPTSLADKLSDQQLQNALNECTNKVDKLNLKSQQTVLAVFKLPDNYSNHIWSDTEHIYETIPESDSEPIYACPYEQRSNLVPAKCCSSSRSNSSGEEKDSSSAYNTGESCNSNPITLKLHNEKDHHKSTLVLCPPKSPHGSGCNCGSRKEKKERSQGSKRNSLVREDEALPSNTMYTNAANLEQTMLLQQQLFKEALNRRNHNEKKTKSHGEFQAPNLAQYQFVGSQQVCTSSAWVPPEDDCNVRMEWKVKRRADGTRYITRRTVRNRILKTRAVKISEERAGHTTEDDTVSEMKVGRYWSKEERKKQLERARERKQQKIISLQQSGTNEEPSESAEVQTGKTSLNIMELSHKKMARKKATIDDFMTVQEILVHGNKVGSIGPESGGKLMGFLSVTTV